MCLASKPLNIVEGVGGGVFESGPWWGEVVTDHMPSTQGMQRRADTLTADTLLMPDLKSGHELKHGQVFLCKGRGWCR
jgi:hypothetical protein